MKSMSDPVKSSEIEDVLASIRRLVSEEARGEMQARRQNATQPQTRPEAVDESEEDTPVADALVLTPALRVHEGGRSAPEVPEAAEVGTAEQAEDQTAEEIAEAAVADVVAELAEDAQGDHSDRAESDDMAVAEVAVEDDVPEPPTEAQTLETKIAALEALIADNSEAWQPAEEEPAEASSEPEQAEAAEPEGSVLDTSAEASPDLVDSGETALDWEDHLAEPVDDSAELDEADATESAESAPEFEELIEETFAEGPVVDDVSNQDDAGEEFAEAAPVPREETYGESQRDDDDQSAMDSETSDEASERALLSETNDALTIDEDTLREMVVDIVREELQGALGERITRNVRRLVRREIHRALASQELD